MAKGKRNTVSSPVFKLPKKAKQVTGNATKLKKLAELKKAQKVVDNIHKENSKRFTKEDKAFTKVRILREQLGID
jgi:hypothetical protein